MYDELRSLDPRQRRRVEQRLAVSAHASTCSMNAAALILRISQRTLPRWRYRYRHGGILELAPRYPTKRRCRMTAEVRALTIMDICS
jgi:transposase